MSTTKSDLKTDAQNLLHDKGWKGPLVIGIVTLVLYVLLTSVIFDLVKGLVEAVLFFGGLALLCLAAYRAYPTIKKNLK